MSAYAVTQALIIAIVVVWSAAFAARRLLPTASRRIQARVADWLASSSHPAWMRRIGAASQPTQVASGGCGSGSCSTCGTCASSMPSVEAQPLVFKPRTKG